MLRKRPKDLCLFRNAEGDRCKTAEASRGLCISHYSIARGLVAKGLTTWDKLVKEGRAKKSLIDRSAKTFFLGKH